MARPDVVSGVTKKIKTGCGSMYCTVNTVDGKPFEVFAQLGKAGGCASAQCEAIARLASLALRSGASIKEICNEILQISCDRPGWDSGGQKTQSCADAIGLCLRDITNSDCYVEITEAESQPSKSYIAKKEQTTPLTSASAGGMMCPECSSVMVISEGCATCHECGYSKCS